MTHSKHTPLFWLISGILCSILLMMTVFSGLSGKVLVTDAEQIPEAADGILNAIHTGDWSGLSGMVSGDSQLTPDIGQENSAERLLYEAYQESLQWSLCQGYEIQGHYVSQKVMVTCLDISGVTRIMTENLDRQAADDPKMVRSAAEQILMSNPPYMQREITLHFLREKQQWHVVPDSTLLALLSGFLSH
jgi:hypothetical protein